MNKLITKPTYQGFIDFINNEPAERAISHCTWGTCAVGDYIKEVTNSRGGSYAFSKQIMKEDISFYAALGSGYGPTYGALQAWISLNNP